MRTKKHMKKNIVTFLVALALVIGMIPLMPDNTFAYAQGRIIDLSNVTEATTLQDGDTITGTLGANVKISIADGATVTLNGITINGTNNSSYKWAGITCEGDATIILAEGTTNVVKGFYEDYPGINVQENKTLTIQGSGSLEAANNGFAAGIGGGFGCTCGNIIIKGGSITAKGGRYSAAIGNYNNKSCGSITVGDGVIYLNAIKGEEANNSIGPGYYPGYESPVCGPVMLFDCEVGIINGDYLYDSSKQYTVKFNNNGGTGSMDDLYLVLGKYRRLPNCGFTKDESVFVGWSTMSNGDVEYIDGQIVKNLSTTENDTVTLYAVWKSPTVTINTSTGDIRLVNGQILTGIGGADTHVTIADGATVTLSGVTITDISTNNRWAGITCEGDATIILADNTENHIKGGYRDYPGIYVPVDKTLVIDGAGSLEATNNGYSTGIGAGWSGINCGNIIIKGGRITAIGKGGCAGIGGTSSSNCGNITIEKNVTYLYAEKGETTTKSIGYGEYETNIGNCGTVTICDVVTGSISGDYTYAPSIKYNVKFDKNRGNGSMSDLTLSLGEPLYLPENKFTWSDIGFLGWSRTSDGDVLYSDGQMVISLTDTPNETVTLYAVWDVPTLKKATISGADCYWYTGSPISIKYTVTDKYGNLLTKGVHFTETIKKNDNVVTSVTDTGSYTLTLTGIGDYEGSKDFNFNVVDCPEGMSIDTDFQSNQIGYYYVNMPSGENATESITLLEGFTSSFKVYDDGGKTNEYTIFNNKDFQRELILQAPQGYKIQLTGTVKVWETNERSAWLEVYNGTKANADNRLGNKKYGNDTQSGEDIGTLISDGENVTLVFKGYKSNTPMDGLNLTVSLIKNQEYNAITINTATGGSVASDRSSAKLYDVVTMTAIPTDDTYMLNSISVKDVEDNIIPLSNDMCWYSGTKTATFSMPGKAVTVTPVFTNNWTATEGGLSITMPKNGYIDATHIPSNVQSFKVSYNYRQPAVTGTSTLKLIVPDGYVMQLSGTVNVKLNDPSGSGQASRFFVYDGENNSAAKLVNVSINHSVENNISNIISTGRSMYIYCDSPTQTLWTLDLTIMLIPVEEHTVTINNSIINGQVVSDKTKASTNETVTVSVNPDEGYVLQSISVTDDNGDILLTPSATDASWGDVGYYSVNEFTFKMRASNATVNATFMPKTDFYVNMQKTGESEFKIPAGTRAFKVYDNSGKNGGYFTNDDGKLLLTAPEGYVMNVSGYVKLYYSSDDQDYLDIYDGSTISATSLGRFKDKSGNNNTFTETPVAVTSSTNQMLLHFVTNNFGYVGNGGGVYLTVSVLPVNNIIIADEITGGTVISDKSSAAEGENVTLTATPNTGYIVKKISANNGAVAVTDNHDGTYTFTMPAKDVTITAEFELIDYDIDTNAEHGTITVKKGDTEVAKANYNDTLTVTVTPNTGYQLSSISVKGNNDNDISLSNNNFTMPAGNVTVTIECIANTYKVVFDKNNNDATGTMADQNFTYDEGAKALTECSFVAPMGYSFDGWATSTNGDKEYSDQAEVSNLTDENNGTVTLYAKWTPIDYSMPIVNVIAKASDGGQVSANITGNGTYKSGTKASLSAKVVEGYNFKGWYLHSDASPYYTGNSISTANDFEYTVTEDVFLTAVYEPLGKAELIIKGGDSFTVNKDTYNTTITKEYLLGSKITVETKGAKFAFWQNKYGMVLSRSKSYTFTVTGADEITAVFDTVDENKVNLVFESAYGQVMAREQLASGGTMTLPGLPTRNGYKALGWDLNCDGKFDSTSDTIASAIEKGLAANDNKVTIKPVYELKIAEYDISVTGGTGAGKYSQDVLVTVTANVPEEGKKFSHWEDSNGKILSYSTTYSFFAEMNVSLTAVYVLNTEDVIAVGTTEIIHMYKEGSNLIFVSMSTVPEGCTIIKAGAIATDNSSIAASEDEFTDDKNVYVLGDAWSGEAYRYTLTITNSDNKTWHVRAYLVYTDKDGNTHKVYGPIVTQ